jgi:hypothetical protein
MINGANSCELNLTPKFGFCNDVKVDNDPMRKIVWLVPHVIKHKGDAEIITWRCNWGNVCNSECLYAMSKERSEEIRIGHEVLPETGLRLSLNKR